MVHDPGPVKAILLALALAACAAPERMQEPQDSVVPGTIGVIVRREQNVVVVSAMRSHGLAAAAGVRVGDVVLSYNGKPVRSEREFYRMVIDSAPGSLARLELLREGAVRVLEVPVGELDTMPRV